MISRIISNFKSKLEYVTGVKRKVSFVLKNRTSKAIIGTTIITGVYLNLYQSDDDYLVDEFPHTLPITLYRVLPLCQFSRIFGNLANKEIPEPLRELILGSFVKLTSADLSDFKITDIKEYKSLSELFRRQLKWDSRVIDRECDMVSPCDGKVLYCGSANKGTIEQVKGVNFTLSGFLGKDYRIWRSKYALNEDQLKEPDNDDSSAQKTEIIQPKNLFYITLYLAPGDYHRFHSPTEVDLGFRRYFCGKLLSVNPWLAKMVPGLFSVNERVVYFGQWKHGLLAFTAVGATNVGNIRIFSDRDLPCNETRQALDHDQESRCAPVVVEKHLQPIVRLGRGQLFGEFNLGSTIVILFEAPSDFRFTVAAGDKVQMGMCLGSERTREPECRQM